MLLALLMSLTNNTSYSIVDTKEYPGPNGTVDVADESSDEVPADDVDTSPGYYTIDIDDAPNYRDIMSQNPSNIDTNRCKTATFSLKPKHVESSDGYWVIDGKSPSLESLIPGNAGSVVNQIIDDDDTTIDAYSIGGYSSVDDQTLQEVFSDKDNIVMPFDGKIVTEGNMTMDSMTVVCCKIKGSKQRYYKLLITGMRCWYCDYGRENALTKKNTLSCHTFKKLAGHKVNAGCVLGRATKKTAIEIYKCDSDGNVRDTPVSVIDFYKTGS